MDSNLIERDPQEKLLKLKKMRLIATSLLVAMSAVYLIFKRFETQHVIFSYIVAFSEAAMIGALADWFAVSALFRHPLKMSWIPHTAIIPRNKDKIGDSLSSFVVSNFFTPDAIKSKLDGISFTDSTLSYWERNKLMISGKIAASIPGIARYIFDDSKLPDLARSGLISSLKKIDVYPLVEQLLQTSVSSGLHIPIIKQLIEGVYQWVAENKDKTIRIIEGMNRNLALPFIGDIVYRYILKTLLKLVEDIQSGAATEFNREVLRKLPIKLVNDLKNSAELRESLETKKNELLDSEVFHGFINEKLENIKAMLLSYGEGPQEELNSRVVGMVDSLLEQFLNDPDLRNNIDHWIKEHIINAIGAYRQEIAGLISGTVKNWPVEDMVEKMEIQVGGDLQYIRINGTVVGGLAGLVIHILSQLI